MKRSIIKSVVIACAIVTSGTVSTMTGAAATEMPMTIPSTSAGIWQAINVHVKELHAAIALGKLNTVHQHAFAVRDLVRALPAHSANLSASALATVKSQTKYVDTLADRLDHSGDANDKAGTVDNARKLDAVLKALRAQYP